MKESKKEIKYIIRRILIGVGIAIILFNLKKCNAYALTKIQVSGNSVSKITDTTGKKKVGEYKDSLLDLEFYFDNNISFNYYYPIIYKYRNQNDLIFSISGVTSVEDLSQENISLGSIGTTKDTAITSRYTVQYPPNLFLYDDNNTLICNVATSCNSSNNAPFTAFNYMQYNFMVYNSTQDTVSSGMNSNIFGQYIYNNTDIDFYNSNVPFDLTIGTKDVDYTPPVQDPLANYTQLDLTGHQALLLVPKNYQTMLSDSSHTNEPIPGTFHTYLDLDYYSQYCVQGSLIDINNTQDILTNNIGVATGNLAETISGTCYEEPTQTILSYQFDMYSGFNSKGILIYNNSKNYDNNTGWINNQQTPFGQSYVWYNSSLYNYYFIDNFDSFNADITYIDFSGEEKTTHVENIPTFTDFMNSQKYQDSITDNPTTRQKISQLLNLVKLPFTFLNSIINGTCEPLQAPIPHTSSNIQLPCLSSQFESFLGQGPYNFFRLIINGLLCYRIIISLIVFTERNFDPSDARIEVMDL